jgi:hypothetical protein
MSLLNCLSFKNESGDIGLCPNYSSNISEDGLWLSSKIPPVRYQKEQELF